MMTMADFPSLPLWTDAYLADTADLDACEHGCYLVLLMIAWRRPDCSLPNDLEWMRRSLNAYCGGRMHGNRFNSIVPKLLSRFFTLDGEGKWQQKRLRKERDFVLNFSRSQREKVEKRWAKVRENKELADTMVIPPGITPTPTPTPNKEERPPNGGPKNAAPRGARLSQEWVLPLEDEDWAVARGMPREAVANTALKFKNHWLAKSGKDATKIDWSRTWQNWVLTDIDRLRRNSHGAPIERDIRRRI